MNKIRKAVLAASVMVLASGCAHHQAQVEALEQSGAKAVKAAAEAQPQTLRPTQSYGTFGGYRYRRFTGV